MGFPGGSEVKASAWNAGDKGSIPGFGKIPWRRKCNPLQYSCLGNPMGRGAWWATAYGVAMSWTQLCSVTEHTLLQIHPCCWKTQNSLHSKIIGIDKDISQFLYPFIHQWTFRISNILISFSLDTYSEMKLPNHMVVLFLEKPPNSVP